MAITAVAVASTVGGFVTLNKSPRYGGGDGPLFSTVNGFIDKIVSGDVGVIDQLNQLRLNDADKVQWQLFWDQMVPIQPLTAAQIARIKQLDPTKTGLAPRTGSAIYADPKQTPPTLQEVAEGIDKIVQPSLSIRQEAPMVPNPVPQIGSMPLWLMIVLAAGAAWLFFRAVKKAG